MYPRMRGQSSDPDFAADRFWAQLDRYLAGEASPDDRAAVEQWVANDPANAVRARAAEEASASPSIPPRFPQGGDRAAMLSVLRDARSHRDPHMPAVDVARMWRDAQQRTNVAGGRSIARDEAAESKRLVAARRSMGANRFTPSLRRWGIAVVVCAAVVGVIVRGRGSRAFFPSSGLSGRVYATAIGQRAVVQLSDGSRVTLAPQSTLTVDNTFGRDTRSVALVGEAYFEVTHTSGIPFVVTTRDATTHVLGTTFDVQQYPSDHAVSVTVVDGKVAMTRTRGMRGTHAPVTLTAGMTGIVTDSSGPTVALGDASHVVTWIDGQLVFHKAPTATVLAALTRWYGYEFRLTDSTLANERLTLWLSTESSMAALKTLKQVLNAELTVDHGTVTLSPRRGAHAVPRTGSATQDELAPSTSEVGR